MNNDLISRSELKKAINKIVDEEIGIDEKWAKGLKYSLNLIDNAPTVEPKKEIVPVCKVTFDKEQLQEIVDKKVAEMLERPQGEWHEWTDERWGGTTIYCPYCKENALKEYRDGLYRQVKSNFCPNCGADMRKGGTNEAD